MLNLYSNLFDIRNTSEKLFPSKNINLELQNGITKNMFDNDLIFEDIYKDTDSFPINTIQNPSGFSFLENNNFSSMNTTNEYKIYEYFDYAQLLFKQETNISNKPKIFKIAKTNKKVGRLKKIHF